MTATDTPTRVIIDGCQINAWDDEVLAELAAGGVTGVHATCAVWEGPRDALRNLSVWNRRFRASDATVRKATTAADLTDGSADGTIAVVLGFQNSSPIEDDLELVEQFHQLGVRIMQLTYNVQNLVGGSCYEPTDSGLTRYGHLVVAEMNRVGMLVDLSHVGERTSLDAIHASTSPVAITHANPRSFVDSPRNKSDVLLKELAAAGGVIGCTLYPPFIGGADTSLDDFCRMVEQLCADLGPRHVAIGSDLTRKWDDAHLTWLRDGTWRPPADPPPAWPEWPDWFGSAADFPTLASGLRDRGIADDDIDAILGGNWLRLFAEVFGA
jgi:membrane dipeptidase